MNSTSIDLTDAQKSQLVIGHFNGQELYTWNLSTPFAPTDGLYSTVNDMMKSVLTNIGLIKTNLDNAMQKSHLIRQSTILLLLEYIQAYVSNDKIGFYVGLGWIITTNFGNEIVWYNGLILLVTLLL